MFVTESCYGNQLCQPENSYMRLSAEKESERPTLGLICCLAELAQGFAQVKRFGVFARLLRKVRYGEVKSLTQGQIE